MKKCTVIAALAGLLLSIFGVVGSVSSRAEGYPTKPVRIIVPFAAGGGHDFVARLIADRLTAKLGQRFYVENKPGAGSQIGIDYVARSAPDGYTLGYGASDSLTILPALKASVPYKVPDDFTFITRTVRQPFVLAVNPKLPINSVSELIAYGKANPGKLRFGTAGVGSAPHLATALLEKAAGLKMVHVPYGGASPAVTALLGGFIDLVVMAGPSVKPHVASGGVRALAVTSSQPYGLFPGVPTLEQAGLPNVSVIFFQGLVGPAGTPDEVSNLLRKTTAEVLKEPEIVEKLETLGYEPSPLEGAAFKDAVVKELDQWRDTGSEAGIVLN